MEDHLTEKTATFKHAPDTTEVLLKANVFVPICQVQLKVKENVFA